jgi:hypothetical protein
MATKNFDSLLNEYLSQLTEAPVYEPDPEEYIKKLKAGIDTAPGDAYGYGKLADALKISKENVIDLIGLSIYNKVFPGGVNPANNNMSYRASIANAVKSVILGVAKDNKIDLKGMGDAVAGFTARITDQLSDSRKEYGPPGTRVPLEKIKADISEEGSEENGKPATPKVPKAARYLDEAEYEILTPDEMSAAGVELSDDLKTYYSRVENIADQVQKGKDIVRAIQRGGTEAGSATKAASRLISAGAIKYATAENSDQDVAALEAGDEDMEDVTRREFEKSFSKTYQDAMKSEPSAMNLGYED